MAHKASAESKKAMVIKRNIAIREAYSLLEAQRPRIVLEDMLKIVADQFYLAPQTVYMIIIKKGAYKNK